MFNGIIKNTGRIHKIIKEKNNFIIEVKSNIKFTRKEIGSSISCSGTCLTLTGFSKNISRFFLSKETLKRTIFKFAKRGDLINFEKSLKFGERLSGHFVQGHVDTICYVDKILHLGKSWLITFYIKKEFEKYIVEKGSVAINGISLTIAKKLRGRFQISVIPKTLKSTNLLNIKNKDRVNVEFDVLGKYIENFKNKL